MFFRIKKICIFLAVCIAAPLTSLVAVDCYEVHFNGVTQNETLALLKEASQLIALEDSPPATNAALRRRVEADIPNFIKVLHGLSYYSAKVNFDIDFELNPVLIEFHVEEGPSYPLADFQVIPVESKESSYVCPFPFESINLQDLGINLNSPALPKDILHAEETLLQILENNGYPLAKITKRDVLADQTSKCITVILHVDSGPLCYFGDTTITGNCRVSDIFFRKKVAWDKGKLYSPCKVERTQSAIEASGLFSSINIVHGEEAPNGCLPMEIQVIESKQRSIGAGLSYSTELGFGVLGEWEHRNFRGIGEKLSFKANIAQRAQEGTLLYVKPDFRCPGQDLLWLAELQHETTKGFRAFSLSLSGIIEKQVNDHTRISYGGMFKRLRDSHSDNNREFNLVKAPFQLRWSNANNILDPTWGQTLNIKITPSLQIIHPQFAYCINTISTGAYYPITKDHRYVLAAKATFGSILGEKRHSIPPSERFYAGSENTLRGYHYLTVSPLNRHHDPIGGRSMMIYNFETRIRASEKLGWVLFYDLGNVYTDYIPEFRHKLLQSGGVGLRYNTPVGPLRLDLAFPFNPRKHLDDRFQVYLSIGQAF